MGRKKQRAGRQAPSPVDEPGGGLGGLAAALTAGGLQASGSARSEADSSVATGAAAAPGPTAGASASHKGKAVVRRERKGRGGKTVTVIDGSWGTAADPREAAKAMRKALGTGARVEDGRLVLQGDQRAAAAKWLESRGATVVLGN